MPCFTVQRMSVKIEAADRDLLEAAIKRLGLSYIRDGNDFSIKGISITRSQAWLESPAYQDKLNEIKRAYSQQVVHKTMMQKKWVGSWKSTRTGAKITLKKY